MRSLPPVASPVCPSDEQNRLARTRLDDSSTVDKCDSLGYTALHVACSEGWHQGVELLVRHGANVNAMPDSAGMVKGVRRETPLHIAVRQGDVRTVHLLQETADLSLKDGYHSTVLHLAAMAKSSALLRTFLLQKESQTLLNTRDVSGNSVLHSVLQGECEDEDLEERMVECLSLLLDRGVDANSINLMGESPLLFAARSKRPAALALLLRRGADATLVARDGTTVLHAACGSGSSQCLRQLIQLRSTRHHVKTKDCEDQTPFHLAVQSYSLECCQLLLSHGDHLARRDHKGETMCSLALRYLPGAYDLFEKVFDSHLVVSGSDTLAPQFSVTFDFSPLISPKSEDVQSSLVGELATSATQNLLKHPLVETFLFIKWRRIKPFFYCNVWIYLTFLILHSAYVIMTFGSKPTSWTEKRGLLMLMRVLHIMMFILILVPNIVVLFLNWKKCLRQWETFCKALVLCTSSYIVFSNVEGGSGTVVETHIAALSGFFGWVEFMILLGRFPSLGVYILMFSRVAKSLFKFIMAFSSLLVAFAICFYVLMKDLEDFGSFSLSFARTLIMMMGEIDYVSTISRIDQNYKYTTIVFMILFLFLVAILMANLLIGLAVNDVPELQRQGKIHRLAKEVSYLVSYERLLTIFSEMFCFPHYLRLIIASRCKIPCRITIEPNRRKKRRTRRMPNYVPSDALKEAIRRGSASSASSRESETPVLRLLRSMNSRRTRDQQTMEQKLEDLQKANERHVCSSVGMELQTLRKELQRQAALLQQLLNSQN